jgi:hypothetical protein
MNSPRYFRKKSGAGSTVCKMATVVPTPFADLLAETFFPFAEADPAIRRRFRHPASEGRPRNLWHRFR